MDVEEQRPDLMRELTTDGPTARTECGTPEKKGPLLVTIKLHLGRDSLLLSSTAVQKNLMLCNNMFRVRQLEDSRKLLYGCNLSLGDIIRSAVLVSPQLICNGEMHVSYRCRTDIM